MNLFLGSISTGLLLSLLTLGIFITYRVMGRFDLTTDGSFGLGAAAAAALLQRGVNPILATLAAAAAGWLAGATTGLLYNRLRIDTLLGGILVTTGLYTVQLYIMGGGDISLAGTNTLPDMAEHAWTALHLPETLTIEGTALNVANVSTLIMFAGAIFFSILILHRFLRTDLGLAMRSAGDNDRAARALGVDTGGMVTLGFLLANGLVAFAGALFAQYQGFANVATGSGMIVSGLACLILGEGLLGRRSLGVQVVGALVGTVVFRLLVAGALLAGLPGNALKLATALFVLAALVVPGTVDRFFHRRRRGESQ